MLFRSIEINELTVKISMDKAYANKKLIILILLDCVLECIEVKFKI